MITFHVVTRSKFRKRRREIQLSQSIDIEFSQLKANVVRNTHWFQVWVFSLFASPHNTDAYYFTNYSVILVWIRRPCQLAGLFSFLSPWILKVTDVTAIRLSSRRREHLHGDKITFPKLSIWLKRWSVRHFVQALVSFHVRRKVDTETRVDSFKYESLL